jgi:hypothetical protein
MYQPSKWWWGLIPLALIWVIANWTKAGPIKADLESRATAIANQAAPAVAGVKGITATVTGRDVASMTASVSAVSCHRLPRSPPSSPTHGPRSGMPASSHSMASFRVRKSARPTSTQRQRLSRVSPSMTSRRSVLVRLPALLR